MDVKLFTGAHLKDGYVNYSDNLLDFFKIKSRIILKGGPACGKSTFIKRVREYFKDEPAILIPCACDLDSVDGAIIPSIGVMIIDGTPPHEIEPQRPGDVVIDLGSANKAKPESSAKLEKLERQRTKYFEKIYANFKKAYDVHMKMEELSKPDVDFSNHDLLFKQCVDAIKKSNL